MRRVLLSLELRRDGKLLDGFPYERIIAVNDAEDFFVDKPAQGPPYKTLPINRIFDVQGIIIAAQQEDVCLRFNGQMDGEVVLHPGGVVVIWDTDLNDSPSTNATAQVRVGGNTAFITGLAIGSGLDDNRPVAPPDSSEFGGGGFGE